MRTLTYYYSKVAAQSDLQQEVRDLCISLDVLFLDVCIDNDAMLT